MLGDKKEVVFSGMTALYFVANDGMNCERQGSQKTAGINAIKTSLSY